mgnify:CR=1 FL=1
MSGSARISSTTPTTSTRVYSEIHIGTTALITCTYPYVSNSLAVFFNGVRLAPGTSYDYTETSPSLGTFTLLGIYSNPSVSDTVLVDYDRVS